MQSSGDNGVILVAFGTTLGNVDRSILAVMADAFGKLPQKFIWKLSEGKSANVLVRNGNVEKIGRPPLVSA